MSTSVSRVLLSSPPLLTSSTPPSQTWVYEMSSMTSPLEPLQLLQKIELPSRLSNLYPSLTASLKETMSLICHTAMKRRRGRPSSWVWQWRERKGERMRGRCMRVEMGCRCYQKGWSYFCLGLDNDILTRIGSPLRTPSSTYSTLSRSG